MLKRNRVNCILESKSGDSYHKVGFDVFDIRKLIYDCCLELYSCLAFAVNFDSIVGNPADTFLHIHHADICSFRRCVVIPVELKRHDVSKLFTFKSGLRLFEKRYFLYVVDRNSFYAAFIFEQNYITLLRQFVGIRDRTGFAQFLDASRRDGEDGALIRVESYFSNFYFCADIRSNKLRDIQSCFIDRNYPFT